MIAQTPHSNSGIRHVVVVLLLVCSVLSAGCEQGPSQRELLQKKFDAMKGPTDSFVEILQIIRDKKSAEENFEKIAELHGQVSKSTGELNVFLENNSSRTTDALERKVSLYKVNQKEIIQREFKRMKRSPAIRAALETFLQKVNVVK